MRAHQFFAAGIAETGLDPASWWSSLPTMKPPAILPYLPATDGSEAFHSNYKVPENVQPGLDDAQLTRLMGLDLAAVKYGFDRCFSWKDRFHRRLFSPSVAKSPAARSSKRKPNGYAFDMSDDERRSRSETQRRDNPFHRFVEGNLILKSGLVDKRKVIDVAFSASLV